LRYAGDPPNRILMIPDERRRSALERAGQDGVADPNAAIASALLADGAWLLAFNNAGENRETFRFAVRRISATPGGRRAPARSDPGSPGATGCRILVPVIVQDRAGEISRALHLGASRASARAFQHGGGLEERR